MNPETLKRRKDIITLLARGFSQTEIADVLQVPEHTVYNDIREVKKAACEELLGHTCKEVYRLFAVTRSARVKELWRTITDADSAWVKVQALKSLRNEDALLMKLIPLLGLPKMTEEEAHQHALDIADPVRGLML